MLFLGLAKYTAFFVTLIDFSLVVNLTYLFAIVKDHSTGNENKKDNTQFLTIVTVMAPCGHRVSCFFFLFCPYRFLKNLQVIMTTILKSFRALSTIVMLQGLFLCILY